MLIYVLPDTRAALKGQEAFDLCTSRSLWLDRFAAPAAKDDNGNTHRKDWFLRLDKLKPEITKRTEWVPVHASTITARLQSRLLINMAGGVMENAGICLDRYGMPYIPGSAVKACARRAALAALREWSEGNKPEGADNFFTPLCKDLETRDQFLTTIALVFGWVEQDWSTDWNRDKKGKPTTWKSDFAWACGGINDTWKEAAASLYARFKPGAKLPEKPWESLPNYNGSIAFLSASPNQDPGLELDVVTCHHGDYYSQKKDSHGKLIMPTAFDTEDPVPVLFPAVKEQGGDDYFTFPLMPLLRGTDKLMPFAKLALGTGLETFGIGAKTNAGYGVFLEVDAQGSPIRSRKSSIKNATRQLAELAAGLIPVIADEKPELAKPKSTWPTNPELIARFEGLREAQIRGLVNLFKGDETKWPEKPRLEGTAEFQISLLAHLTEINREIYDQEKVYAHSKFVAILKRLAASHNLSLPE